MSICANNPRNTKKPVWCTKPVWTVLFKDDQSCTRGKAERELSCGLSKNEASSTVPVEKFSPKRS
jgi:hypothetical protein